MASVATIAQQTVREAVRTKVVAAFGGLLVVFVALLPMAVYREGGQMFALVQTFLSWSLMPLGVILSLLAVFLGALSISDELVNRQIYILLSKPVPRWKYIVGKWLGVVLVLSSLLTLTGLIVYGMTYTLAGERGTTIWVAWNLVGWGFGLQVIVVFFLWLRRDGFARTVGRYLAYVLGQFVLGIGIVATMGLRPEWMPNLMMALFYVSAVVQVVLYLGLISRSTQFGAASRGIAVCALTLMVVGVYLVGMNRFLGSRMALNDYDRAVLTHEILTARARVGLTVPQYDAQVELAFQRLQEEGRYRDSSKVEVAEVKTDLYRSLVAAFHRVPKGGYRVFEFRNVNVAAMTTDGYMHLRYKARGEGYAPDEALISYWYFGPTPGKASEAPPLMRKDVMDRYQTIPFPADAVSPEGTVYAVVRNMEGLRREHHGAGFKFEQGSLELLYTIGTFGGNLIRTLFLVWCRVVLIAAIGIFAATSLSYPVACLVSFVGYVVSVAGDFVLKALEFGTPGKGALGKTQFVIEPIMKALFAIMPRFAEYNGVPNLVDGRNVSLVWDLLAFGKLVLAMTTGLLLIACIIFRRRQVAELSV